MGVTLVTSSLPSLIHISEMKGGMPCGAFSVNPSGLKDLCSYIDRQDEHHRKHDFKKEYREFLAKEGIEYDERYVWD